MPKAVSDSSVLIHLGVIGRLELLPALFEAVLVPDAVWQEVVTQGRSKAVVEKVQAAASHGWLRVETARNAALMQTLRQNFHAGESEAICLALEQRADVLLMDETDGREAARNLGLSTKGVVGLLIQAKRAGHLAEVRPAMMQLVQSGFYLSPELIAQALQEVGEKP